MKCVKYVQFDTCFDLKYNTCIILHDCIHRISKLCAWDASKFDFHAPRMKLLSSGNWLSANLRPQNKSSDSHNELSGPKMGPDMLETSFWSPKLRPAVPESSSRSPNQGQWCLNRALGAVCFFNT